MNTKEKCAIKVQITGKGKCKWMEIMRKSSNNETSTRSLFYSSKEIYAHSESPLAAFEPRGVELNPGEHTFDFSMPLEWNLPSSFKGSYGSIKYKLRVLIQRPWTFDERHIIPIKVVKHMPLHATYRANPTSLEKQITKTISLFGTRPITMVALLPEDFAVRGEPMRICVTVTNNSTTNVEKLRFSVLQYIWYYSHVPLRIQKTECVSILCKETGAVQKKSERSFAHELLLPITAQPSDDQFSGVINISYELRVEAVLRGFFKNLVLNLPFKMYSYVEGNGVTMSIPPPPRPPPTYATNENNSTAANNMSNSFDSATSAFAAYPMLDTLIGSPTHSAQFSESSSINSTTSDSSAATLSPAVGGAALSYTSGSSSQFNSPTTRNSFRSSNVPYMPYSSSPRMVSSYPPPHFSAYALPDSPQYSPLPSTSYLRGREPPGAHEQPPSYEELFGNATAPLDLPK
ncbi:arrestin domain-containing protein 3-like [Teleopsis dalmanni]|uniref:arrestin domain-containing protein 3-like n=1 Tax=Teleopsis dalmanni TaxID=139649 RepID=UPI0018CFEB99|nr:arrestin domain-containing protein 3-like [Teleopsis dalmanni]